MVVRSQQYPEVSLILDGKEYRFHNYLCDLPDFLALRVTQMNTQYVIDQASLPKQKDNRTYFEFDPNTWTKDYKKLIWDGPIGFNNGYGKSSMFFMEGLSKLVDLYVVNSRWIGTTLANISPTLEKVIDRTTDKIDSYYVKFFPAFEFTRKPAERFIGYTMLEASRIPKYWVDLCNDYCERVVVPCTHQKQAFIDSGVKRDIEVVPLGLICDEFPVVTPPEDDLYYYGTMGTLTYRKGTDVLIKAFTKGLPKDKYPNARLFIKTQPVGGIGSMWFMTREEFEADGRIDMNIEAFSPQELIDQFFAKINCFVFPTRGEGFGLPPLEAMCCGLPMIGTDWSGLADFMTEETALKLKYKIVDVPNATEANPNAFGGYPKDLQAEGQQWAEPDVDDLIDKMRWCYDNREKAKAMGQKASIHVRKNYNIDKCAKQLIKYLDKKF